MNVNLWLCFLSEFNGRKFFLDERCKTSKTLNLSTADAAGSLGYGDVFGSYWCCRKWTKEWLHTNIAVLEFYPIV